jgi:hypothetical protein
MCAASKVPYLIFISKIKPFLFKIEKQTFIGHSAAEKNLIKWNFAPSGELVERSCRVGKAPDGFSDVMRGEGLDEFSFVAGRGIVTSVLLK